MQYPRSHELESDHGLPLVQLKERRRELVVSVLQRSEPPTAQELVEIAAIQHSISAFGDVIADLDAVSERAFAKPFLVIGRSA
jgi:hypothetical protein